MELAGGAWTVGARAAMFFAITLAMGAVAFLLFVLPRLPTALRTPMLRTFASAAGAWSCAALIAIAPARLFLQASVLVDAGDPVSPMAGLVLGTTWGHGWEVQLTGAVIALVGFLRARRANSGGWQLALTGTLVLAVSAPLMGHAVSTPRLGWLSVTGDALHVASAGTWVGTLFVLALVSASLSRTTVGLEATGALVATFHPVALRSAALVVSTGLLGLWFRLPNPGALLSSHYGNVFLWKAGAVLTVATFGAFHARIALGRTTSGGANGLLRSLTAEAAFAVLTILATAILVGTDPPDGM